MKTRLCDYYYNGALRYAKDGRLDKALELCAVAWGLSEELEKSEEIRKLTGLCYCTLGNYNMADYCFEGLSYYTEDIQKSVRKKMEFIDFVSRLINGGQYKKAVKALEDCTNKSVAELNMLGCLYAMKRKGDKAVDCFLQALELNKDGSVSCIKNARLIKKWWFI